MGRVIMMVVSSTWLAYAVSAILTGILVIAVFTIQEASLLVMIAAVLASIAIAAAIIIILPRTVIATFTEDKLLVSGRRGGFSLPRDVVVGGNVVCIEWDSRGRRYNLRVVYSGFEYSIPLASRWVRDRLVGRLREHWGWTLPECPN